jgi:hypothetical protein
MKFFFLWFSSSSEHVKSRKFDMKFPESKGKNVKQATAAFGRKCSCEFESKQKHLDMNHEWALLRDFL